MRKYHFLYNFLLKIIFLPQICFCESEGSFVNNQTLIQIINDMNTTWRAGENEMEIPEVFDSDEPENTPVPTLRVHNISSPDTFDARLHWEHCESIISRIRSQGKCGSCWAVSSASMLSDRLCIESSGTIKVHLSAEDITTCCRYCRRPHSSCAGGRASSAIYFWMTEGVVTGGERNSSEGCKPYSEESSKRKHSKCTRHCSNRNHWREYNEDKHRGKMVYYVRRDEESIKNEIFTHGPVVASFATYKDLRQYKTGVYRNVEGARTGSHAIRIIGWGEESGEKYWLVANSWGTNFGLDGYVKFLRGENHLGIERKVIGGRVSDILPAGETLRESTASRAHKRRFFLQKDFLHWFCFWILVKETLQEQHCFSFLRL